MFQEVQGQGLPLGCVCCSRGPKAEERVCSRLLPNVRPLGPHWEDNFWTIFGLELDGGKGWRSRLPGALEGGLEGRYENGVAGTKCWESWEGEGGYEYEYGVVGFGSLGRGFLELCM